MMEGEPSISALQELCSVRVEKTAINMNNYIYISALLLRPRNTFVLQTSLNGR